MDRLTFRNDFGFSAADREHRLVFEGTPESNPPPPPRVEQGNLNDFDRLHQGAEDNNNTSERTYNNVYDRMSARQQAYRKEVAALSEYIQKAGGNLESVTAGTRANVTRLIDNLQNVYSRTYVDRNGQTQEYRNGLYARVNEIERSYVQIETMISSIENDIAGGPNQPLPAPLTSRYQDRVRAKRTADALRRPQPQPGNGSVDVRTYSVPFTRESMSETSTYSLLRVPANFNFNWSANPAVAAIVNGNFDIQGGMSNGIQYLRLRPSAATQLAAGELQVPVTVTGVGGRIEGTTVATFKADGPISENPNVGNTLVRIEYGSLTGPNGEPVNPDGPDGIPTETPEQIEAKNEQARKEYHDTWVKLNSESNTTHVAFAEIDGTAPIDELLLAARAEQAALVAERSHLELRSALPPPPNGENPNLVTYDERAKTIPEREQALQERVDQLQAYATFAETQTKLAEASDAALNLVSPTIPAENDVEGWQLLLGQLQDANEAASTENGHLITFEEGDPTPHSGANANQRQEVEARTEIITKRMEELGLQSESAQEGVYEAKRQVFDKDWGDLNNASLMLEGQYNGVAESEDVDDKIAKLGELVTALQAENALLSGERYNELEDTKEGGDDRFATWSDRIGVLGGDGGLVDKMEQRLEQFKAYKEFDDQAAREEEVTQSLADGIPDDPASNDVEGWETVLFACNAYKDQLGYESAHLATFTEDSAAYAGATEMQRDDVDQAVQYATGEECQMTGVEIPRVEEALREAKRQKFDEDWAELKAESDSTASWEDGDPENTEEKIDLLQKHVDALTAERSHLEGRTDLEDTKEGGDNRFDTWNTRYDELNGDGKLLNEAEQLLEKFKAFKEFRDNADTYQGESVAELENIPVDPTDAAAVTEWQAKVSASERYLNTRLLPEQGHLNTFDDSQAAEGATDMQKTAVTDRKAVVETEIKRMQTELPRVEEALKNAQRLVFDREATRLQGETTTAETLRTVATGHDDFDSEVTTAQQYLDAIDAELKHLKEEGDMKYPPTDLPDGAMMRYDERIQTLNKTRETVEQEKSISQALLSFQETRTARTEATAKVRGAAEAASTNTPPEGDITNWRDKVQKLEAYVKALNEEGAHIRTLPFGGSDAYRTEVTGRGNEIAKILEDLSKPLEEARKNVEAANNITQLQDKRISRLNPQERLTINRYEAIRIQKRGPGGTTQDVARFANLDVAGFPKITRNDTTHEVVIDRNDVTDATYDVTVGTRTCTITVGRGTRRTR